MSMYPKLRRNPTFTDGARQDENIAMKVAMFSRIAARLGGSCMWIDGGFTCTTRSGGWCKFGLAFPLSQLGSAVRG